MRLVLTQNTTLDARADLLGDWFDPTEQDAGLLAELHRQDDECDAVLLGRHTFEAFRAFWPAQADDTTGVTDQLNRVRKYVVSATLADPGWENSTVLSGDPVEEVRRLKLGEGRDIVCTGSVRLSHTLIRAGLVDEFRFFTYPVVQGEGRPLFPHGWAVRTSLISTRAFDNGVVLSIHRPSAG